MIMLSEETLIGIDLLEKALDDCKADEDYIKLIPEVLRLSIGRSGIGDEVVPRDECCLHCECTREEDCGTEYTLETYLNSHKVFTYEGLGKAVLYDEPNTMVTRNGYHLVQFNAIHYPKFDKYFIRTGYYTSYGMVRSDRWVEVDKPVKVEYHVFKID
jgi:hypothetical protein